MKKLSLLLITLTTFMNVSYASFPVTETQQTEIVETNNAELSTYSSGNSLWAILSISCVLLSLMLILNPLVATIIALLGVVFGAIGFNKKLKGLAITGFILSLIIFLVSAFLAFVIFAFGGDPTKLGD
jgi:cation transporter-like permease